MEFWCFFKSLMPAKVSLHLPHSLCFALLWIFKPFLLVDSKSYLSHLFSWWGTSYLAIWCLLRWIFVVAWWSHWLQWYFLTPSCMALRCLVTLWSCLMIAFPTLVFQPFMQGPLMFSEITLWIWLMFTFSTSVLNTLMNGPLVLSKTTLRSCVMVRHGCLMSSDISLWSCLMVTILTLEDAPFMYGGLMFRIFTSLVFGYVMSLYPAHPICIILTQPQENMFPFQLPVTNWVL